QMQAAPVFSAPSSAVASTRGPIGGTDTQSVMSATQPIVVPVSKGKGGLIAVIAVALLGIGGAVFAMSGGDTNEGSEPDAAASAVPEDGSPEKNGDSQ